MWRILDGGISQSTGRRYEWRGYATAADRDRAIRALTRLGFNHFVCYRDVQAEYALSAGWCDWAIGHPYICR